MVDFLKVSGDKVSYILTDTIAYFNFLNIPGKLTKDEILKVLNLENSNQYLRFYKKYLYWQLVSDNREFCENFEKSLKNVRFVEDTSLRYEYLPQSLKSALVKKIQRNIYNREASELKANTVTEKSQGMGNNGGGEAVSWRKKSNDLTAPTKDSQNSGKITRFNDNVYKTNSFNDTDKSTNTLDNTYNLEKKVNSFNDVPIKRERFNSDGDKIYNNSNTYKSQNKPNSYNSIFGNGVKLDYSKLMVKYNVESKIFLIILVKYKFSNKEMMEIYEKVNSEMVGKPEFALFVEDVCDEAKKSNLQMNKRSRMVS